MKDDDSFSRVAQANDAYEAAKLESGQSHRISVTIIERRFKLAPGQLKSWRANNLSRKGLLVRNGPRMGNAPESER